jgi:GNAT superfamily N-acetyltransferase
MVRIGSYWSNRYLQLDENRLRLSKLFLETEFQNKGLGSLIIKLMEFELPLIKDWSLYTPYLNKRNHHFYEKLGYIKIGEKYLSFPPPKENPLGCSDNFLTFS